ncbi:MAG TPA: GvpL/GvpF family gas vesicle protein [Candidatus Brocadiaceae bacterium]
MSKIADTNQANSILSDTSPGIYTYCLTRTRVSFPHTMMGIDGAHGVYHAEQDGIFAVISDVSLKEYSETALDKNMTDMAWLVPRAKRHEEVIEFVMTHATLNQNVISNSPLSPPLPISSSFSIGSKGEEDRGRLEIHGLSKKDISTGQHTPVVPLRFCTIYKNQEGLLKAIIPHKEKILNFLDYTADKIEWSVKVFCDKEIFIKYSDKNKEPSATAGQASLLPGEAYLLAKKMRKIKEENFKQGLQMYLKDIDFTLSQFADSYRFLQCTDKSIHGRPLDMVMNTAFLIEQQTFTMFKDTLDMLAEKYRNEGLSFEFSGPWPPYNFCPAL